jgi:PiT family inorganic phosphate transporter
VILLSSHFGYSLSTTHVATGSILGSGVGKKGAEVRWNVAGRMATAWVFTLPVAGLVGALAYFAADGIGGTTGVVVIFAVLVIMAAGFYLASRKTAVSAHNVNEEWPGSAAPDRRSAAPVPS